MKKKKGFSFSLKIKRSRHFLVCCIYFGLLTSFSSVKEYLSSQVVCKCKVVSNLRDFPKTAAKFSENVSIPKQLMMRKQQHC